VPGAGRLPQRVLRVAEAWAESQTAGGYGAAGTGSEDLGGERPDVWATPGVGGAAGLWGAVQPLQTTRQGLRDELREIRTMLQEALRPKTS
jgi:hypothetical protein